MYWLQHKLTEHRLPAAAPHAPFVDTGRSDGAGGDGVGVEEELGAAALGEGVEEDEGALRFEAETDVVGVGVCDIV